MPHRPAVIFCLPLILGILLGWLFPVPCRVFPLALAFLLCLFLAIIILKQQVKWIPLYLFISISYLGFLKINFDVGIRPDDGVGKLIGRKEPIMLYGRVTDAPHEGARSYQFGMDCDSARLGGRVVPVSGQIMVTVRKADFSPGYEDSLPYGRNCRLRGKVVSPGMMRNPGDFDIGRYYLINNLEARFLAEAVDSTVPGDYPGAGDLLANLVYPVRKSVCGQIERFIGGEEGNFLKGLLVGERSTIPPDVKNAFINAGVMHIIAVSGLHVAIVGMIIVVMLQLFRVPGVIRTPAACLLLVYYNYFTGSSASVTRSVIMGIIFLAARTVGRLADMYNTLALSAVIILLIDAKQLLQPGFQLSFGAVFALVFFYPKVTAIFNVLPARVREYPPVHWSIAALSVSVAAGIGTLPFTSFYFAKISVIGFVANMVIVPLSNVVLAVGMLAIGVAYLWPWGGEVYAGATKFLTWLLLRSVEVFGGVKFAYVGSHFTILSSLIFYAAVGIVMNLHRPGVRRWALILLLFWANWTNVAPYVDSGRRTLRVTMIDVGQGDAILVEVPGGKSMLVDAGPRTTAADAGLRYVIPFLSREGVRRPDVVVISHPHSDHLGGIPAVLRSGGGTMVVEAGTGGTSQLDSEYRRCLDSLGCRVVDAAGGERLDVFAGVRIYVLHPTGMFRPHSGSRPMNMNNQSVVLKICYGRTSLLLSGDAEAPAERRMIAAYGPFLRSDVIKIAHHGSITGTTEEYLENVRPSVALISVGAYNRLKHPSPVVLARLKAMGCTYRRTDESGAVIMESDGNSWQFVEWR